MNRGEVWWARLPEASPRPHPVVLLSWDARFDFRSQVTVAPVTSMIRGLDAEIRLDEADGLGRLCVVNCDAIATIRRSVLVSRITQLGPARMRQVERAVHRALGMRLPCTAV